MDYILHDGLDVFLAVGRVLFAHRVRAEVAAVSLRNAITTLNIARGAESPAGSYHCLKLTGQSNPVHSINSGQI